MVNSRDDYVHFVLEYNFWYWHWAFIVGISLHGAAVFSFFLGCSPTGNQLFRYSIEFVDTFASKP
jgi:hypothetical protein